MPHLRSLVCFICGLLCLSTTAFARFSPADSIGVERKGSKILVLYRVEAGETLSSISRKYNTSVDAIKAENTLTATDLKLGEVIKVPYTPKRSLAGKKVHTVEASQTLYSIARMYGVTGEDIKKWNGLTGNEISLGQQLIVGEEKENATQTASATPATSAATPQRSAAGQKIHVVEASQGLFAIAKLYGLKVEDLRAWNNLESDNLRLGQEILLEKPAETTSQAAATPPTENPESTTQPAPATPQPETAPETPVSAETKNTTQATPVMKPDEKPAAPTEYAIAGASGYVKKVEAGMAEVISDSGDNSMFLALHRTAPVGTIMQVRNQMNDLSVFVKVIGKLPDTGANDRLIVKLSKKACERLAAIDKRFRVEVSYMP